MVGPTGQPFADGVTRSPTSPSASRPHLRLVLNPCNLPGPPGPRRLLNMTLSCGSTGSTCGYAAPLVHSHSTLTLFDKSYFPRLRDHTPMPGEGDPCLMKVRRRLPSPQRPSLTRIG